MNSIEERLARDIGAVTGGVVVDQSELWEAQRAVNERIESKRRRVRPRTVTTAAAAVVVLAAVGTTAFLTLGGDDKTAGVAAPSPGVSDPEADYLTGSDPTPRLLAGVWRVDNDKTMLTFSENGTVRFDDQGALFSRPGTTGTYVLGGDLITVTITKGGQASCLGTEFALRASFPESGAMRFVRSSPSGACLPMPAGRGALEKVLPTSRVLTELRFSGDGGWKALTDRTSLYGVWLAEGGGHVLEMDPDGSYYIADDSGEPIDRGRWSFRDHDLTLISSAQSAKCSDGDQFVLGAVKWINPNTSAFRGTLGKNACGGSWTPAAWILIPNARN